MLQQVAAELVIKHLSQQVANQAVDLAAANALNEQLRDELAAAGQQIAKLQAQPGGGQ